MLGIITLIILLFFAGIVMLAIARVGEVSPLIKRRMYIISGVMFCAAVLFSIIIIVQFLMWTSFPDSY